MSDVANVPSPGAAREEDAAFHPRSSGKPLLGVTSPLELLADQALARERPLPVPQELLAAAVARYRHSVQHWSFGIVDVKSPPPPPQSSPVGFPVTGPVLPQLLNDGNKVASDGVDITHKYAE